MLNVQPSASAHLANLDAGSLADFFGLITEAHTQMEQSLLLLQIDHNDSQSLSELTMAIDSIHNALADYSLGELRELTSSLLQLVYTVRQRQMTFSTTVGDIILLATLDIKAVIEKSLEGDASPATKRLPCAKVGKRSYSSRVSHRYAAPTGSRSPFGRTNRRWGLEPAANRLAEERHVSR